MENFNQLLDNFKEKKRMERKEKSINAGDTNTRININSLEHPENLSYWEDVKEGKPYSECLLCKRNIRNDQVVEKCSECDHYYHYREYRERKRIFAECPNCKNIRIENGNLDEDSQNEDLLSHLNKEALQEDLENWKEVHRNQDYTNCLICKKEFVDDDLLEDCPICGTYFHYLEYLEWSEKKSDCPRCHEIIAESIWAGEELPSNVQIVSDKKLEPKDSVAPKTESPEIHKVFISYSSTNEELADMIVEIVESLGVKCWISHRDIVPSEPYARAILEAINHCQICLVLFSKTANKSHHVRREIELAVSRNHKLLPVRIEDTEPTGSMKYYLSSTHWLNAFQPSLEANLDKIGEVVKTLID
ncbi:MAG: TIR domain-containing protein [Candidatus Hodarchaeales archaeon]|jgi:hypothetical protein